MYLIELEKAATEGNHKDTSAPMEVCCCEACSSLLKVLFVRASKPPADPCTKMAWSAGKRHRGMVL